MRSRLRSPLWQAAIAAPSDLAGVLPGASGDYFSTPDSAANSITGDIDIRVKVAMDDWTPAANNDLVDKYTGVGNNRSYIFRVQTDGTLAFIWSANGIDATVKASTAATGFAGGSVHWIRVTMDVDNGAAGYDVKFYTSSDGTSWTQLGTTVTTATPTSIYDGAALVAVGADSAGTTNLSGVIYRAQVYNGIDGTLAVDFKPSDWRSGSTWVSAATGETWTINGNAYVD